MPAAYFSDSLNRLLSVNVHYAREEIFSSCLAAFNYRPSNEAIASEKHLDSERNFKRHTWLSGTIKIGVNLGEKKMISRPSNFPPAIASSRLKVLSYSVFYWEN